MQPTSAVDICQNSWAKIRLGKICTSDKKTHASLISHQSMHTETIFVIFKHCEKIIEY